jgi:5-methylcytosine-specific restriction endonuclease McrA
METLVLNVAFIPISIIPCRRAVTLVATEKAVSIASYPDLFYHSSKFVIALPSVIKCIKSSYTPKHFTNILPFNRKNVYIRDHGCCMYCGKKVSLSEFTFEHVIPQSLGGKTWWDNIVVSCTRCNSQKSDKSLKKYKRQLIRAPYVPKLSKAAPCHVVRKLAAEIPHKTWIDYIYWNVILID